MEEKEEESEEVAKEMNEESGGSGESGEGGRGGRKRTVIGDYHYPSTRVKRISFLVHIYSTVGERVPICLLRILLNI